MHPNEARHCRLARDLREGAAREFEAVASLPDREDDPSSKQAAAPVFEEASGTGWAKFRQLART